MLGNDAENCCVRNARAHEIIIHAGAVNRDHVHMLLSIPPSLSVARAVQHLKGRSSHKLLSEFGILRKRYWGEHRWSRGYWVGSSGNVTDEVWMEYIKSIGMRTSYRERPSTRDRTCRPSRGALSWIW